MTILGIHWGHDASVCLINNNKIIYNVAEERLNNIKHVSSLPVNSLDLCFKTTRIDPSDIDYVAVGNFGNIDLIKTLFSSNNTEILNSQINPNINNNIRKILGKLVGYLTVYEKSGIPSYQKTYPLKKDAKILQIEHHLAHASSAYFTSGFNKCLIITADGIGDMLSVTISLAENGNIKPILKIGREGSLGFFYSIVTEALGWEINEGEGKTMGLAPYGNTKKTKGVLDFITPIYRNGKLIKSNNIGFASHAQIGGKVVWHFTETETVKKLIKKYGKEDIAAEAQRVIEEQMLELVVPWIKKLKIEKLVGAGGIFLNVKMNQKIWETGLLKDFFVYPDAGDGGIAIGAALFVNNYVSKSFKMNHINGTYWGTEYNKEQIEKMLKSTKINYKKYKNSDELIKKASESLAEGKIIGWFQGKMESGPRALGNRSILMDPRKAKNKNLINAKVKFREEFRPFCPSMTPEAAKKYLINPVSSEFMAISFNVPEERKKDIPAVVHIDGTTRPQVVAEKMNPLYFKLITEFGKITGVPVLLNTSFNIKGQPIVENPLDAIRCFYTGGLDCLFIGNFMIKK